MNHEQFDRVEAYLQNALSGPERLAFESELKENTELRTEVEVQQKIRLGLRALAIEKRILDARKRTQITPKTTIVRTLGKVQNWGLAASVAVMLGAGWLAWQYNQESGSSQLRELAEQEMTDVRYKSMPFDSLQNITKNANSEDARQKAEWYVALAYMHEGKKKEAKGLLIGIAKNPDHAYQKRAEKLLKEGFK
ncbi:hypothetical protein [Persicitalea jodogahamensis]|uniref:Uncharacterized protein n=1 Tax=Persicitalea jodogahamensis TaxID=402147 RepID=A0A8J3D7X1_9BACT|nr:hypothetical protein [Persicitalea jodogahamensis]GHB73598.1 hypothetical protein GCM10007390_29670 [Persicitalea jodogahamensis]